MTDHEETRDRASTMATEAAIYRAPPLALNSELFRDIRQMPDDLDNVEKWGQTQSLNDNQIINVALAHMHKEIKHELAINKELMHSNWKAFRAATLKATKTVLGGASVFTEFRTSTKGRDETHRGFWIRLRNLGHIASPEATEDAVIEQTKEAFSLGLTGRMRDKVLYYLDQNRNASVSNILAYVDKQDNKDKTTVKVRLAHADPLPSRKRSHDSQKASDPKKHKRENSANTTAHPKTPRNNGKSTQWSIGETSIKLRFDSGSDVSFASTPMFEKLAASGLAFSKENRDIQTASGSIEKAGRSATVTVTDNDGTEMSTVIYELNGAGGNSVYLGRDVLKRYNILIDFGTRRFRLNRKWLDM